MKTKHFSHNVGNRVSGISRQRTLSSIVLFAAFILMTVNSANAQLFQLGVRLQYSTSSIDEMVDNVTYTSQNFNTDFIKRCEVGPFLRLNLGSRVCLQAEANFSLNSVWDTVDTQEDFFEALNMAFEKVQAVNLAVPVMLSIKLIKAGDAFGLRLYGGPEFYTTYDIVANGGFDSSRYSLIGGVGIDLLDLFCIDARVSYYTEGTMHYRLGVGLLF